ncbi:MAG: hypothetical protein OXG13_10260 [Gemmatimonadaceae bacterium]|nr:hypothetical protein [Gemmatimonadaceae bacterium]
MGLSGGTAMEFTDDLDLTIGYYDIANESLLDPVPEADPEETAGQADPRPGEHPLGLQRPRLVVR